MATKCERYRSHKSARSFRQTDDAPQPARPSRRLSDCESFVLKPRIMPIINYLPASPSAEWYARVTAAPHIYLKLAPSPVVTSDFPATRSRSYSLINSRIAIKAASPELSSSSPTVGSHPDFRQSTLIHQRRVRQRVGRSVVFLPFECAITSERVSKLFAKYLLLKHRRFIRRETLPRDTRPRVFIILVVRVHDLNTYFMIW